MATADESIYDELTQTLPCTQRTFSLGSSELSKMGPSISIPGNSPKASNLRNGTVLCHKEFKDGASVPEH